MRAIPQSHKNIIDTDVYFKKCARHSENDCQGRLTIEHAFIYAGRQIAEVWAYLPLCAYHHEVDQFQDSGDLDKELNQYLCLKRATDEELLKYPRKDWKQLKKHLYEKYKSY